MTTLQTNAPWHYESFCSLMNEALPGLLAERISLAHYSAAEAPDHIWTVSLAVGGGRGEAAVTFSIPGPDAAGLFHLGGQKRVVVPAATAARLDESDILCVGDQLLAIYEDRIAEAPANISWDGALLRDWLALEETANAFLRGRLNADCDLLFGWVTVQNLDDTNYLARATHLRRIVVPHRRAEIINTTPKQTPLVESSELGRTCPFETPEGPNVARVLSIARGATIRNRKLVNIDNSHAGKLGLTAGTVPCFNHTDSNRLLMGVNMMRQWIPLPNPEPALVQTGMEPSDRDFWCGRNLLTAYMSWGAYCFEDAIVISESAARRLSHARPVQVGDKLSNRHGQKGVISLILPDDRMPQMPDGRAVDLLFSVLGTQSRMSFGQFREGLLGLIANREGQSVVVPPFAGPDDEQLQECLREAGLPEHGMSTLSDGKGGEPFARPTLAVYVYWGLTHHLAHDKLGLNPQVASFVLYQVLRDLGANHTIRDLYNTQPAGVLSSHAPSPPAPMAKSLQQRLALAGIDATLADGKLQFSARRVAAGDLQLAQAVPHPWLPDQQLTFVGSAPGDAGFDAIARADSQVARLLRDKAPQSLVDRAMVALAAAVDAWFAALIRPEHLQQSQPVPLSGRAVIVPADGLTQWQIGIPDTLAWKLFEPLVARELGADAAQDRTPEAAKVLDRIMAEKWVLLVREPAVIPTSVIAFHAVRRQEEVIRLHPLCCAMLNADHDGDQVAVYLPITDDAQREAGERLTCAGHLRRDPSLIRWMVPRMEAVLGLAYLSLEPEGKAQIIQIAGSDCMGGNGFVSLAGLREAMGAILRERGPECVLDTCHRLMNLGFEVLRKTGASSYPFAHRSMPAARVPTSFTLEEARVSAEAALDQVMSRTDYQALDYGPQLLAIKSGARGNTAQLLNGLICRNIMDYDGKIHHFDCGHMGGLTPEACFMSYIGARIGIAECALTPNTGMRQAYGIPEPTTPQGFHVLARAMRSTRPGPVFARAAAAGEVDPLTDADARLFVGLG